MAITVSQTFLGVDNLDSFDDLDSLDDLDSFDDLNSLEEDCSGVLQNVSPL